MAEIASVAVIWVAETTGAALAVTPVGRFRVAPLRDVPLRISDTLVPCTPVAGVMLVNTGVGGLTVKVTAALVPPRVVTVMLLAPMPPVGSVAFVGLFPTNL